MCIRIGAGEPVIKPSYFVSRKGARAPCKWFLFTLSDKIHRIVKRMLDNVVDIEVYGAVQESIKGVYDGVEVCVVNPYYTAPPTVFTLELLVASGAEGFIALGEAGSLTPLLRIGDILVPIYGVREEGVSYHYMPPEYTPRPDPWLVDILDR